MPSRRRTAHRCVTCAPVWAVLEAGIADAGDGVRPGHQDFIATLQLVAIALLSAFATAALVIGVGRTLLPEPPSSSQSQ